MTSAPAGVAGASARQIFPAPARGGRGLGTALADRRGFADSVDFSLVNLTDPQQVRDFRGIDVIFCRNLLIYFDDLGRRETASMFHDALAPGGFVCLGHSESMSRMSSLFVPRRFPDAILYQKPVNGGAA